MRKKDILIISILVLAVLMLMSGCTKKPDDNVAPIEPAKPENPETPKETIANTTWPKDKIGDIPEPKGNIILVYEDEVTETTPQSILVQFEVTNKDDALEYFNQLKELGYTVESETNNEQGINLDAVKDGNRVKFGYTEGEKTASIKYEIAK